MTNSTGTRRTEPLREEHRELLPHLEALRTAADSVGIASPAETLAAVDEAIAFLKADLLPHAAAEEAALYPAVERVMGAPGATNTMRADHVRIGALAGELAAARSQPVDDPAASISDFRRLLYSLHAIVELHFSKEEEVYLPALDVALTPADAARLFEALEAAAHAAKARRGVE